MVSAQQGFTITEVMMFLAISGLLLLGALVGIGSNISNTRFNDGVRSTVSYLQEQYNEVSTGRSDRPDSLACDLNGNVSTGGPGNPTMAPGMTDCVILGRFIKIEGSTFTARYITGIRSSFAGLSGDDTAAINQMNPVVAGTNAYEGSFDVPWQIGVVNSKVTRGSTTTPYPALGFAIIRSPASGNVLYYSFGPVVSAEPVLTPGLIHTDNLAKQVDICFSSDDSRRFGIVTVESGQGQEVIRSNLSSPEVDCT